MKASSFFLISAWLSFGSLLVGASISSSQTVGETPKDMLAAQIRLQGFTCDKPLGASKDTKRSRPDYAVWVLRCVNATYRVSRYPDMAAKVELLR